MKFPLPRNSFIGELISLLQGAETQMFYTLQYLSCSNTTVIDYRFERSFLSGITVFFDILTLYFSNKLHFTSFHSHNVTNEGLYKHKKSILPFESVINHCRIGTAERLYTLHIEAYRTSEFQLPEL